jgi:thioredoxin-related protein
MKSVTLPFSLPRIFTTLLAFLLLLSVTTSCTQAKKAASNGASWSTNYQAALQQAQKEGKPLLLDFTGSDWCPWCIKLDKEILSTPEFVKYAHEKLILVKVDFPQSKPQSDEVKTQNRSLSEKFHVEGFPTLILLKPNGEFLAQSGYLKGGPQSLIKWINSSTQEISKKSESHSETKDVASSGEKKEASVEASPTSSLTTDV